MSVSLRSIRHTQFFPEKVCRHIIMYVNALQILQIRLPQNILCIRNTLRQWSYIWVGIQEVDFLQTRPAL